MQLITQNESTSSARRIVFVLELPADRNAVQEVDLGDIGAGDTFTLTFDGQTTSSISQSSDMTSAIDSALEALSNIEASDISIVKQGGVQVYDITFAGSLAATDVATLAITPTGFTPGGVTMTTHGGPAGAPARNVVLADTDIEVSKNGGTFATSAGTVTEMGHGLYYYTTSAGEVDTLGPLSVAIVREDLAMTYAVAQIMGATSDIGAPVIRSGTAQAGDVSTITLDASASSVNDFYAKGVICYIRSGTGSGQCRLAYDYDGTTKVLSVEPTWATVPDNTSTFDLLPCPPNFADIIRANHAVSGTFGGDLVDADEITVPVNAIEDKVSSLTYTGDKVHATLPPTVSNPA